VFLNFFHKSYIKQSLNVKAHCRRIEKKDPSREKNVKNTKKKIKKKVRRRRK